MTMERRGWDEKKDWGRGKKGSGEGMGGWVHEGKGKAGAERWWVGPLVLPSTTHPEALDAGHPGCTVPGIARERAAHTLGQTGRTLLSLSSAAACGLHHPQKTAGAVRSSQPHSVDSQRPNGTPASDPFSPSPPTAKPTPTPNPHSFSQTLPSS